MIGDYTIRELRAEGKDAMWIAASLKVPLSTILHQNRMDEGLSQRNAHYQG